MAKRESRLTGTTSGGAGGLTPDSVTVDQLAELIEKDRLARFLSWPKYAQFLGIPQATVYKIYRKVRNRPHQTTIARILQVIADNPVRSERTQTKQAGVRPRGKASDDRQGASVSVVPEGRENR